MLRAFVSSSMGEARTVSNHMFEFAPEQRFALTILTNAEAGLSTRMTKSSGGCFKHYLGISEPTASASSTARRRSSPSILARYETALTSVTVRAREDGALEFAYALIGEFPADSPPPLPPPFAVAFYAADTRRRVRRSV